VSIKTQIQGKLSESLMPDHLEVINESYMHAVPPGSESHFKVVVVSSVFAGKSRVQRQQMVHAVLADELKGGVHALSMETVTGDEWQARGGQKRESPACLGGGKADV
jgi:BolA protein